MALAHAEINYATSITEYNVALADLQYRSGQLLEYNSVRLAEGPWTAPAYEDADRHARERDRVFQAHLIETQPQPFAK